MGSITGKRFVQYIIWTDEAAEPAKRKEDESRSEKRRLKSQKKEDSGA